MILRMARLTKFVFLLLAVLFVGCSYMHNKEGMYIAKNFEYTIDTLKLYENGSYEHIIYDKQKSKLININTGHWEYEGNRLVFSGFLFNEDDLRFYNDSVKYDNVLMKCFFNTALLSNKIIIDYDLDKYYDKVKDY